MHKFIISIILLLSINANANEVYFGKYIDSTYRDKPDGGYGSINSPAQFVGGVYLEGIFAKIVSPHMLIETLMSEQNSNGSFKPASVKYDIGLKFNLYEGSYIDLSRMCWHSIDSSPSTEEYYLIKVGYKW